MRILEQTLHGWDLAVSVCVADDLDDDLADYPLIDGLAPITKRRGAGVHATPNYAARPSEASSGRFLQLTGRSRTFALLALDQSRPAE